MRNSFLWTSVFLVWLAAAAGAGAATETLPFPNNTGDEVNDLHIEFRHNVTLIPKDGPWGPFTSESGNNKSKIDLSGGTVAPGGTASIRFKTTARRFRIKRWWWTIDGDEHGGRNRTLGMASVAYDQDSIRPGEMVTLGIYASGAPDRDMNLQVSYEIEHADGSVEPGASVMMAVPAGHEFHQQIITTSYSQPGSYTISFETLDLDTGELVTFGEGTLEVDSGLHMP